jgi:hypothetical protein
MQSTAENDAELQGMVMTIFKPQQWALGTHCFQEIMYGK